MGLPGKREHPTPNIQHPTSNDLHDLSRRIWSVFYDFVISAMPNALVRKDLELGLILFILSLNEIQQDHPNSISAVVTSHSFRTTCHVPGRQCADAGGTRGEVGECEHVRNQHGG